MPTRLRSDTDHAANITGILSDVDGVMTDGRIIFDNLGVETKQFHVRDGLGIKLWMRSGFAFGIITARQSDIVDRRAAELGIADVQQGVADKRVAAEQMCRQWGCTMAQVCYIGDDLPDIATMKATGLSAAPADAARDAREAANWILHHPGGSGVVRELVERLLRAKGRWEEHLR